MRERENSLRLDSGPFQNGLPVSFLLIKNDTTLKLTKKAAMTDEIARIFDTMRG